MTSTTYRVNDDGVAKARFGFPYGDFQRVSRSGLIHAKQRASQNGHDEVERVAGELLDHLEEVRAT